MPSSHEIVPTEAVEILGRASDIQELKPIDKIVMYFGIWLLVLISLVIVIALLDWIIRGSPAITPQSDKTAIETAKAISYMQWDRISKVFDLIVIEGSPPVICNCARISDWEEGEQRVIRDFRHNDA